MRMSMRRFTRLTNAFSRKIENHAGMVALYMYAYNFIKPHRSLKNETPAMAAGLVDWRKKPEDIVAMMDADYEAARPKGSRPLQEAEKCKLTHYRAAATSGHANQGCGKTRPSYRQFFFGGPDPSSTGARARTRISAGIATVLSWWRRGGWIRLRWIRLRWIRRRRVLAVRAPLLPPRMLFPATFLATFLAGLLIESHLNPPYRSRDDCRCSPSGCDIVNTSIQAEGFLVEQDDESQYDDQCHPVGSFVSSSDLAPIGLWWVALGHLVSFCQTSTSCHPL